MSWSDADIGAVESWHEANSSHCAGCGERWLTEQMTDRLGVLFCPDCITEQPPVSSVRVAGVDEAKRLRVVEQDAIFAGLVRL